MKFGKNRKFVGKMFDDISPSYDRMNHIMSGFQDLLWRKKAVKYLAGLNKSFSNILDLASGSGDFGKEFLKLNPGKLYSADLSIEMLKINRDKVKNISKYHVKTDAEYLPFRDNYFDLCGIAFGVRNFEHLRNCLFEISRVLKPGAILAVMEMFKTEDKSIFNRTFKVYFEKIMPLVGSTVSGSKYAYEYLFDSVNNFLHVDEFISLAEETGFILQKKKKNFSKIVCTVFLQKN
jgi:demethylmenaquinone methyltransferase / 2-methoxy-6-polyprenyl-1,4-benzoquinol methylase